MKSPCNLHRLADLSQEARAALMRRSEADLGPFIEKARPIIAAVKDEGDAALSRFAREFDKADVPADRIVVTPGGVRRGVRRRGERCRLGDRVCDR